MNALLNDLATHQNIQPILKRAKHLESKLDCHSLSKAIKKLPITANAKLLALTLLSYYYRDKKNSIFPSNKKLLSDSGLKIGTLKNAKKLLIDEGYLIVVESSKGKFQTSNTYFLTELIEKPSEELKERILKCNYTPSRLTSKEYASYYQMLIRNEISLQVYKEKTARIMASKKVQIVSLIDQKTKTIQRVELTPGGSKLDPITDKVLTNKTKNIYTPKDTISGGVSREVSKKEELNSLKPEPIHPEFYKIAKEYSEVTGRNDIDQKQIKKLSQTTTPQNARQCLEIIKGDECLKKTTYSLLRLAIHPQILRQRQKVQKPRDPVLEIGSLVEKHGGKYTNEFEAFKALYPQRYRYQKEVLIKNYWLAEDHIEEFFAHDNRIFREVMLSEGNFKKLYLSWLENFPERNAKRLEEENKLKIPTSSENECSTLDDVIALRFP